MDEKTKKLIADAYLMGGLDMANVYVKTGILKNYWIADFLNDIKRISNDQLVEKISQSSVTVDG